MSPGPAQTRCAGPGPFVLPPGCYAVRVWLSRGRMRTGHELWVAYGRGAGIIARARGVVGNPVVLTFELPVGLRDVWVGASDERRELVGDSEGYWGKFIRRTPSSAVVARGEVHDARLSLDAHETL